MVGKQIKSADSLFDWQVSFYFYFIEPLFNQEGPWDWIGTDREYKHQTHEEETKPSSNKAAGYMDF